MKLWMWFLCYFYYFLGDMISKTLLNFDMFAFTYDWYNNLMGKSCEIDTKYNFGLWIPAK